MKQLTPAEAIAFGESGVWKTWSATTLARFQMEQECLCVPFDQFHKAVQEVLGRPVWTHEFGLNRDGLLAELQGKSEAPSFDEIFSLLPPDRTVIVER